MAPLASQRIRPGYQGMNTTASPEYLRDGEAVYLENLLPGRDGKLVVRGSFLVSTDAEPDTPRALTGMWVHNKESTVLYSYFETTQQNRHVEVDSTGFGATTTVPVDQTGWIMSPGFPHAQVGDFVYGRNTAGTTSASTRIVQWDGGSSSGSFVTLDHSPFKAIDVADHLERLFVLGGSVPGVGADPLDYALYWSDAGGPLTNTLADWQDDASGLVNQLALRGQGDPGVALAKAGRNLAILRTSSIYLLTGQTPSSFVFQRVADRGCRDATSVVEYKDGFFFMSHDGYYFFDGINATEVSLPIRTEICSFLRAPGDYTAYCTRLAHDYILVNISSPGVTSGPQFSAIYHAASGAWTYLSSHEDIMPAECPLQGASILAYQNIGSSSTTVPKIAVPLLWDGEKLWRADDITLPERGDYPGQDLAASNRMIPVLYKSRIERLASPVNKSQLHRVMMDYRYTDSGSSSGGFVVQVLAGDGTELVPPTTLTGILTATPTRQRKEIAAFTEGSEAQVIVTRNHTTPATAIGNYVGEIHDVWIEHQPARQ